MKKIFNNRFVLWFIQYYNLIVLILYTLGCYVYLYDIGIYKSIYKILISILGFNLSSQIFVGYLLSKLKFCKWQVIAFVFNVAINLIGITLNIVSDYVKIDYDLIIMTVLATIFTTYTLVYFIQSKLKRNVNSKGTIAKIQKPTE